MKKIVRLTEGDLHNMIRESAWDLVDNEFKNYIEEQNEKYPERKLSNVEILDCTFMGTAVLELE